MARIMRTGVQGSIYGRPDTFPLRRGFASRKVVTLDLVTQAFVCIQTCLRREKHDLVDHELGREAFPPCTPLDWRREES
jgi:hypothetical protein